MRVQARLHPENEGGEGHQHHEKKGNFWLSHRPESKVEEKKQGRQPRHMPVVSSNPPNNAQELPPKRGKESKAPIILDQKSFNLGNEPPNIEKGNRTKNFDPIHAHVLRKGEGRKNIPDLRERSWDPATRRKRVLDFQNTHSKPQGKGERGKKNR